MTLRVKEEVLWLNVPVSNTLAVEVRHAVQDLLETAFDFAGAHSSVKCIVSKNNQ